MVKRHKFNGRPNIATLNELDRRHPKTTMAIARPVRALGLAAILMWCFFLYQIFKPGTSISQSSDIVSDERDPNLDRKFTIDDMSMLHG